MENQSANLVDSSHKQDQEVAEALGFSSIGAMEKHFAEAARPDVPSRKVELPFFTHNVGFIEVNAPDGLSIYGRDWKGFCVDGRDVHSIWYFGQSDGERSFSHLQAGSPDLAILEAIQKNLIGFDDLDAAPQVSNASAGELKASLLGGQLRVNATLERTTLQENGTAPGLLSIELILNTDGQDHRIGTTAVPLEVTGDQLGDLLQDALVEGRLLGHLVPSDSLLFDTSAPVVADLTGEQFGQWLNQELIRHGWQYEEGSAIASKSFDTAVGPKEASLYLYSHKVPPSYSLQGHYESEGRNILGGSTLLVKMDTPLEALGDRVAEHISRLEGQINTSFAARLYHSQGPSL